ncbi:hypothetical protein J4G37_54180, partial [Microvirga sp. 3-52]|nr:hypothetical protein [Microvirga sp. 3-52]
EGNVIQSGISTNDKGEISIKKLTPGDYQFVETKAPTYYQLDPTPIKFTIDLGKNEIAIPVKVPNKLITGAVELIKVDKDNKEITLEGAVFKLLNEAGETLDEALATDKDGKITVENLKPGK